MNRPLLVIAGLLLGAGPASADYLLIQINASKLGLPGAGQAGAGGAMGASGGGAFTGMAGGMMGGQAGAGGMMGAAGFMGGAAMAGMQGMAGGGFQPPPKQALHVPPQYRARQAVWQRQQAARAAAAEAAKAGAGMMGMAGMTGMTGASPMPASTTGGAGMTGGTAAEEDTALWVSAYIELKPVEKRQYLRAVRGGALYEIAHKYAAPHFIPGPDLVKALQLDTVLNIQQVVTLDGSGRPVGVDSPAKTFEKKFAEQVKAKSVDGVLYQAGWALGHKLPKEFHAAMAKAAEFDPKHPVVLNYQKVKQALEKKAPTALEPAHEALRKELERGGYRALPSPKERYELMVNQPPTATADADVKARLALLDEAFEQFYYWFALQKDLPPPPLPATRLLAVLVGNTQDFVNRHVGWGSPPMASDAFTPRRENVMYLAAKPTDEAYTTYDKNLDRMVKLVSGAAKVSPEEMLSGAMWKRKELLNSPQLGVIGPLVQTAMVVARTMEEESQRAAITHESTRQLLVATGLFPRHVAVPEWVLAGVGSYFETPVGAVYPGAGLPSWTNLTAFKARRAADKLGRPADVLYNVVTDRYFREARQSAADAVEEKDSEDLADKAQDDAELARSTAWAFVYYLAKEGKLHHLLRYGQELSALPRDMDLDERALAGCFGRAFGVADPKAPTLVDLSRIQSDWAAPWFDEMQRQTLEVQIVEDQALQFMRQRTEREREAAKKGPTPSPGRSKTVPPTPNLGSGS